MPKECKTLEERDQKCSNTFEDHRGLTSKGKGLAEVEEVTAARCLRLHEFLQVGLLEPSCFCWLQGTTETEKRQDGELLPFRGPLLCSGRGGKVEVFVAKNSALAADLQFSTWEAQLCKGGHTLTAEHKQKCLKPNQYVTAAHRYARGHIHWQTSTMRRCSCRRGPGLVSHVASRAGVFASDHASSVGGVACVGAPRSATAESLPGCSKRAPTTTVPTTTDATHSSESFSGRKQNISTSTCLLSPLPAHRGCVRSTEAALTRTPFVSQSSDQRREC